MVLGIFFLTLVSAQVLISPSSVDLGNVYPGEIHSRNFTANTDGIYAVIFNSSNPNIIISPEILSLSNGMNFTLDFIISQNISAGLVSFDLSPSINVPNNYIDSSTLPGSSSSGGGKSGIIYINRTITNTSNTFNNTNTSSNSPDAFPEINLGMVNTKTVFIAIIVLFVVGLVLLISSTIYFFRKKKQNITERGFKKNE